MSLKALIVALALGVLTWPSESRAEKATTNQITKVFSRAGEQSPVILKVKAGQQMTVLAKDGRWIKVRVSGRTGWVPRSKVDLPPEEDEIARNTRRRPFVDGRSTKRGFGGETGPDDRVGADAIGEGAEPASTKADKPEAGDASDGDSSPKVATTKGTKADKGTKAEPAAKPDPDGAGASDGDGGDGDGGDGDSGDAGEATKPTRAAKAGSDEGARPVARVKKASVALSEPKEGSKKAFTAQPSTVLYVIEDKGKWTAVENEEGDPGFILTSSLRMEARPAMADGPRRRLLDFHARIGGSFVSQVLNSGGPKNPPDNYRAESPSVAASVGVSAMFPVGSRYWFGGELSYDVNKAVPGITYMESTTSFSLQIINARLAFGAQTQGGTAFLARAGMHYDAFQVPNVADFSKNTVTLPNQNIMGPTVGAAMIVPRLTPKLSFTASVDAILFGASVSQTKNLEDGTEPTAKAVYAGLGLGYRWKKQMALQAIFDLGYTGVSFGGPPPSTSQRKHMGTDISITDLHAILSFGVLYGF